MAQHWLHIQSVHSMHFFRAARPLSQVSHSWSGSSVLLWKNSWRVTRKTLLFMARTPRGGTTHWVLQRGQRNAWPGPICDCARLDSRHSKQKLWRHGRSLGALNSLLQTGQWSKLSIADDDSPAVSRWRWLVVVAILYHRQVSRWRSLAGAPVIVASCLRCTAICRSHLFTCSTVALASALRHTLMSPRQSFSVSFKFTPSIDSFYRASA